MLGGRGCHDDCIPAAGVISATFAVFPPAPKLREKLRRKIYKLPRFSSYAGQKI